MEIELKKIYFCVNKNKNMKIRLYNYQVIYKDIIGTDYKIIIAKNKRDAENYFKRKFHQPIIEIIKV